MMPKKFPIFHSQSRLKVAASLAINNCCLEKRDSFPLNIMVNVGETVYQIQMKILFISHYNT